MWLTLQHAMTHIWVVGVALAIYFAIWYLFLRFHRGSRCFYFDAQDFAKYENGGGRELPASAEKGTFEPLLKHYISVTRLLITVAAASITFGANQNPKPGIPVAKSFLAFSILYGVLFCASVLYRYDEYTQDVRSYRGSGIRRSRRWVSLP